MSQLPLPDPSSDLAPSGGPAPATSPSSTTPPAAPTPLAAPDSPGIPRTKNPPTAAAVKATARPLRRPIPIPVESKRDTVIAIFCGAGVLAFILAGFVILHGMKNEPSANKLTGTIVEKYATGQVEKEVSFGKKGLNSQEVDSGFYFKIKVATEKDRVFEVPVNEGLYEARKVGDTQSFIRPPGEQK